MGTDKVVFSDTRAYDRWQHLCLLLAGLSGIDVYIKFGVFDAEGKMIKSANYSNQVGTLALDDISLAETPCPSKYK